MASEKEEGATRLLLRNLFLEPPQNVDYTLNKTHRHQVGKIVFEKQITTPFMIPKKFPLLNVQSHQCKTKIICVAIRELTEKEVFILSKIAI
ncbi:hypothetical protein AYI69_g9536 [Smittium culicis]|uniref:Uncharacterized protein n=1 Tax=Smittium culicis TaxID=133412 RepID=A0A1R1XBZ7_9FUNG|nr:hypothetical protein AYI69_g9536 [Smittium culicis]